MILNLHRCLSDMEYCAFILMSSLPAAWFVVGVLLLILLLIIAVLYVFKSREVSTLKKQVDELRDTMRMMRYEEANLARMLHTASKAKETLVEQSEMEGDDQSVALELVESQEHPQEQIKEPVEEFSEERKEEPQLLLEAEDIEQEETLLPEDEEEATSIETQYEVRIEDEAQPEPLFSEPENVVKQEEPIVQVEVPMAQETSSTTQKQPINERRSAIPVDLFSAWFAENEDSPVESSIELEPVLELAQGVEDTPIVPIAQHLVADVVEEGQDVDESPEQKETENPLLEASVEGGLNKEDERFCRKLERVVNARLKNPNLNVDSIAAQLNMGRTNFYRKVRELTGVSPNDYLRRARMERAAELLRTTDIPVSEVCVQVGVPDAQYFSRVFKVYYESTPKAYREKHQTI